LKENPRSVMGICPKPINVCPQDSSQDVSETHLEPKDYILPINFEAVLDENLYSDTVYTAAESMTSEGILTDSFSELETEDAAWANPYTFIYESNNITENKSVFSEDNYVATGTVSTPYVTKKKLVYNSEFKNKLDFWKITPSTVIRFHPLTHQKS